MRRNIRIVVIAGFFISVIFGCVCLFTPKGYGKEAEGLGRPEVEYKAAGLRDPFVNILEEMKSAKTGRYPVEEIPPPKLDIQGVIWGDGPSRAIINNKVVSVGDDIEGAKVIKIDKDGIIILYSGRQYNFSSPAKANLKDVQKSQ